MFFGIPGYPLPTTVEGFTLPASAAEAKRFVAAQNRRAREERAAKERQHAARQRQLDADARNAKRYARDRASRHGAGSQTRATRPAARVPPLAPHTATAPPPATLGADVYGARNRSARVDSSARERYDATLRGGVA